MIGISEVCQGWNIYVQIIPPWLEFIISWVSKYLGRFVHTELVKHQVQ